MGSKTQNSFICSAESEYDEMKKLSLPCSRCDIDLGFVKPTFLIRDADLNLRIAGLPAPAGRWKQRNRA